MKINEKTIVIPLTHDRLITMRFVKVNEHQWQCMASNEYLTDIETFFKNGYYELDSDRQIGAEPARKPMTEEELEKYSIFWLSYDQKSFSAGVRFAENHHGIG